MKVLVVTPWFPNRPGEQFAEYIYASALALGRGGAELRVLVARPWVPPLIPLQSSSNAHERLCVESFEPNLRVSVTHYLSIPRNWLRTASNWLLLGSVAPKIREIYREWDFDFIHAHTEMGGAAALAAQLSTPVVTTIHGFNTDPRLNTPAQRRFVGRTLRDSARVLLVGEPLREHFAAIAGDSSNFRIVHNGFTWPAELSADREIAVQTPLRVVSVSLLQEGKGVDLTLRALAMLNKNGFRDWRYKIVGGGEKTDDLRSLATSLKLDDQVSFTGAVLHSEIYAHLLEADVFLLPSYREAFGVAYLEAMAAGLYTIGIAGQGPSAYIRNRENGLLLPPQDVAAIAEALHEVMQNPRRAENAARQGRKDVFAGFTWDKHAQRLMEEFRAIQ